MVNWPNTETSVCLMSSKAGSWPCDALAMTDRFGYSAPSLILTASVGDVDAIIGGEDGRTERLALRDRLRQHVGRKPVDRRAGRKPARIDADHAPIIGLRGHVIRLRAQESRPPGGQPRFRLGDVGARHLADIEAVARLLELLGEHLNVAAIELEDRAIAQQVHVGGCGIEQDLLLGDAQSLAGGIDLAFCLAGAVGGLKAVESV